ncbi:MAG: pyruvate formate lyase-activating protein [Clostridiales Family XIII bacterium]|jgi:pyruvate formate lyase activating enzyme|nr:pyruvate formate lyase-activating protein [Clostridiales Family XIII bacterium]
MSELKGYIYHRESFGAVDGPGIRYVLFLQGCPLRCLYCHNPDSQEFGLGEVMTVSETVAEILKYKNYIKTGGVTFSGGEPLAQADFIAAVIKELDRQVKSFKANDSIHCAIDTSGCIDLETSKVAIDAADLILLDIKASDEAGYLDLVGNDGLRTWELLDYLQEIHKPTWVRHVLIDGYTLDDEKLDALAQKLSAYDNIELVELLPFHKLGEPKWAELHQIYKLHDTPATTKEQKLHAQEIFERYNLKVQ